MQTRRTLLQRSAAGFGHLALLDLLARQSPAAPPNPQSPIRNPQSHFPARAKRIIFLFMKGGPSHVDTFDPKPLLTRDDGGKYPFEEPRIKFAETGKLLKSPWQFRQYGQSGLPGGWMYGSVRNWTQLDGDAPGGRHAAMRDDVRALLALGAAGSPLADVLHHDLCAAHIAPLPLEELQQLAAVF